MASRVYNSTKLCAQHIFMQETKEHLGKIEEDARTNMIILK